MSPEDHSAGVSWDVMQTEQDPSELIPSLQLLLKETCAFRQQHPGKFCLLVCSVCTFFAVLGRYIPGVVISYALVLGIFLWPLLSSLDLEPILQKMDLGLGNFLHRIRKNHASGRSQPQPPHTEAHAADSDLSSMVPQVDLSLCKELCVSDTEASEISWTEGAFTLSEGHTPFSEGHTPLSEGHTPVTDQSEELDREGLADHLPEFPSLDNGSLTNGSSDEDDLYLAAPHPTAPDPMSLEGALVSAVIQQTMESALGLSGSSLDLGLCATRPDDSDSDVEDFELLDQSELEQCETELGLVQQETQESTERSSRHTVRGFISRLLRRQ